MLNQINDKLYFEKHNFLLVFCMWTTLTLTLFFKGKTETKSLYLFKWGETMLCLGELRPLQGVQHACITSYDEPKSMSNNIQLIIN